VNDGRGRLALWLGASSTKNREELEARFSSLVEDLEEELKVASERPGPVLVRAARNVVA
jgi:hypothetical protein